jgi:nicotinamide phosphoribosyltransferase
MNGYSSDNIAFGQGGALLQIVNRDMLEFAMKCSAAFINGKWVEVYKDPVTSKMKKSKKGRLMLVTENGKFVTKVLEHGENIVDHLKRRYMDGVSYNETNFVQVRGRSREGVR